MNRSMTIPVSLALSLACIAPLASGQTTLWKNPVSGSFDDPRMWSAGAPVNGGEALFGGGGGRRSFLVTLDAQRWLTTLSAINQAPVIDLAQLETPSGAALTVLHVAVPADDAAPSLTLRNGMLAIVVDAAVGTSGTGSAMLRFEEVTAQVASLEIARGAFEASDSVIAAPPFLPPLSMRVAMGAGRAASATFTASFASVASLQVGGDGGVGTVTIASGTDVAVGEDVHLGDGAGLGRPGEASLLLDGGTLRRADDVVGKRSILLGGTSTLTLRGGAAIESLPVVLGVGGGTAHVVVDGPATIAEEIEHLPGSLGTTIVVDGAGATLSVPTLDAEYESPLDISVRHGGALVVGTLKLAGYSTTSLHALDGGMISAATLRIGANDFVEVSGDGATVHVTGSMQVMGAPTAFLVDHGGTLQVSTWSLAPTSFLQSGLRGGAAAPVHVDGAATIKGRIAVLSEGDVLPYVGEVRPLVEAAALTFMPNVFEVEAPRGLFGYPLTTPTSLAARFTDDVAELTVSGPTMLAPGFLVALHATALVDGAPLDITASASWTSSDPRVAVIESGGRLRTLAEGSTVITVNAGPRSVMLVFEVSGSAQPPFRLASPALAGYGDGASGLFDEPIIVTGRMLSANGQVAVFSSVATNLVANPSMNGLNAFLWDEAAPSLSLLSADPDDASGAGGAWPALSADGRFVAFSSSAQLTAAPVRYQQMNVYRSDRERGTMDLVTVTIDGAAIADEAWTSGVTDDGRFVLITSNSEALVADDTNGKLDAFVRDLWTGATTRVSTTSQGAQLPTHSGAIDMTPDARALVLFANVPGGVEHVLAPIAVKRLDTGELIDVTQDLGATTVHTASISADGRFVAFSAQGLGVGGTLPPGATQAFVRDLETNELTSITRLVDGTWSNGVVRGMSMSANGRYVSFESTATNLLPAGTPSTSPQVWRFDRATATLEIVSQSPSGPLDGLTGKWTSISANGRAVAFSTNDPNFAPFDTNDTYDVIVRTYGSEFLGDINADGAVDAIDLANLIGAWATTDANSDLDGDGIVGASDLAILLGGWTG